MHTYLHTYLHTYIPTYIHTYIHTYLHTYIPTYIHTNIPTYQHTNIPTYQHTTTTGHGGGTRRTIPPPQATRGGGDRKNHTTIPGHRGGGPWVGGGAWASWVIYIYIYICVCILYVKTVCPVFTFNNRQKRNNSPEDALMIAQEPQVLLLAGALAAVWRQAKRSNGRLGKLWAMRETLPKVSKNHMKLWASSCVVCPFRMVCPNWGRSPKSKIKWFHHPVAMFPCPLSGSQ